LLGQLLHKNQRLSQTVDEATHMYASYRVLKCGDFGFGFEHPPLARFVAGSALLTQHLSVNCDLAYRNRGDEAPAAIHWLYSQDWPKALFLARTAMSVFALGACILLWTVTRRMFGFAAALIATLLFVFDPTVLAHGALVTTDMAVTLAMPLAVYALYLWMRKPTALRLLLAGATTGLTLIAKHSGVLILPMLCLLVVFDARLHRHVRRPWKRVAIRNLLAAGLIMVVAAGVIWCAYGCHFTARRDGSVLLPESPFLQWNSRNGALVMFAKLHLLPEAYLAGLGEATGMAQGSSPWGTFILGRFWSHGPWYFFPLAMSIKYTLPFLVLVFIAAFAAAALFRQHRREVLFLALPAGFYLLVCLLSHMDSGIRHLLPMQFFLLVLVGGGCVEMARRVRWVRIAVPCLIVLHAAASLHAFPNYLSYANEMWGGSANLYRLLPMSDWGEAYKEARKYMEQHPGPCWLVTEYQNDPRAYGVPCTPIGYWFHDPVPAHMQGTVILSSFALRSNFALLGERYYPFTKAEPVARLAGSAMLVLNGDFDTRVTAAFTETAAARKLLSQGRFEDALAHARTATEIWPSLDGHLQYCRALVANGDIALARVECNHARNNLFEGIDSHTLVYRTKKAEDIDAGVTEALIARLAMEDGHWEAALQHATSAVALAPWSPTAKIEYCRALTANREIEQAAEACGPARLLALGLPAFPRSTLLDWDHSPDKLDEVNLLLYAIGEQRY
jgi:tetratricopeptide (TPR) repeat protein